MTKAAPTQTWDPFHNDEDNELNIVYNKLMVKQLLLGHDAKEDEYNVVEVSFFIFRFSKHFTNILFVLGDHPDD